MPIHTSAAEPTKPITPTLHRTAATLVLAALAVLLTQSLSAQTWTLQWSDEFNGPAGTLPNSAVWTYDTGNSGFGNPEIENYCAAGSNTAPCSTATPNAAMDGNGNLVIKAIKTPVASGPPPASKPRASKPSSTAASKPA